jgi:hypothetical protein
LSNWEKALYISKKKKKKNPVDILMSMKYVRFPGIYNPCCLGFPILSPASLSNFLYMNNAVDNVVCSGSTEFSAWFFVPKL